MRKNNIRQIINEQLKKYAMKPGFMTTDKHFKQTLQITLQSSIQRVLAKHYDTKDTMDMMNDPKLKTIINQCVGRILDEII